MALFKIFRGPEDGLQNVPCHDGYAYFTEDRGNLYIDIGNTSPTDRVQVNAYFAEELRKINNDGTIEYIAFDDIELKNAIKDVAHGGTGRATLTANAILIGNGTNGVKMTIIPDNEIIVGDTTNGIKTIGGDGVFFKLTGSAPQFGATLPIALGGTEATTKEDARTNLDVYSTTEVNNKIDEVTEKAYSATLTVDGWTKQEDGTFKYEYTDTNFTLACGKGGNVPPTITYTDNLEEYSNINRADADPTTDKITFITSKKPTKDIPIIIIDKG